MNGQPKITGNLQKASYMKDQIKHTKEWNLNETEARQKEEHFNKI